MTWCRHKVSDHWPSTIEWSRMMSRLLIVGLVVGVELVDTLRAG